MREKFVNGFMSNLYGEIPEEYLEIIRNELALYVNDFDIKIRESVEIE